MNIHSLIPAIFAVTMVSSVTGLANSQISEQAARDKAHNTVLSQAHFKPNQFLDVRRKESLEHSLSLVVAAPARSVFIYELTTSGDEIVEGGVIHHISMDADFTYIVAVSSADGSIFRIHGFGIDESLAEFEKLMAPLEVRVTRSDQAEAVADFYRKVNPENHEGLTPILRLMDLKQAAERQCQSGSKSFDEGEEAFAAWWKHAKSLYEKLAFQQRVASHGNGYLVQWVFLSDSSHENCGGNPLRAQLEISSDGHVGPITFMPF